MGYTRLDSTEPEYPQYEPPAQQPQRVWLHVLLFVATFLSTLLAGITWTGGDYFNVATWGNGLLYAVLLLAFLTAHEFGHYFAARYHKVDATLPFYIPMPLFFLMPNFGTFGAVIRIRSAIPNRKVLFDIGVAGPLAGFVVCLLILIIGLVTLPPIDYLYSINPEILELNLRFGDTILYWLLSHVFANPHGFLPPMEYICHYPFLCVGWFGLFVTSLNLLPLGQLDGGHITYALLGRYQRKLANVVVFLLVFIGLGSIFNDLIEVISEETSSELFNAIRSVLYPFLVWLKSVAPWYFAGWGGWLFWALLARFFFGIAHPPVYESEPLDIKRKIMGWASILIFVSSISYNGISYSEPEQEQLKQLQNSKTVELYLPKEIVGSPHRN
ncbi:MAG: site-2 protease family protein [Candidatus Kapaibacterium sp.]